jgi:nicotinamide riboside kinase
LCELLAKHYNTVWCPEYAREYLLEHSLTYTYEDLLTIAKGQVELETAIANREWSMVNGECRTVNGQSSIVNGGGLIGSSQPETVSKSAICNRQSAIFIDTDLYVMKVWCEYVFNKCHNYIVEQIAERKYDLYLFCNIDLPWEEDPLREYPDEKPRQELYQIYRDILINQNTPWVDIRGAYEERLQTAMAAVDKLLAL